MVLAFALVLTTALVGYNRGVTQFVPAIKVSINATQPLMDVTQGITDPIAKHLTNIASVSLTRVGTIIKRNMDRYGDINAMANNTYRIGHDMRKSLPHAAVYISSTLRINGTLEFLRQCVVVGGGGCW